MWYTYTIEYYSVLKINDIVKYAGYSMELKKSD